MKTAVVYARYSSDTQTEQSIEGQIRVCEQFAKNSNILIVDTYIDRAMTGTNDRRPGFQKMLRDSANHKWDFVIVYAIDRFGRDDEDYAINKRTLSQNGVSLLSATQITSKNIDGTDNINGILSEGILVALAKYYSAELSQKVLRGLNESYEKGNFTGGNQIYGYDTIDLKNVINPIEGEIVKEIFSKYAKGYTGVSIASDLNKRGIKTKKGKNFNKSYVYKMLENPKYNGKTHHRGKIYTNIYPQIVDDETWRKVQDIRNSNKHSPGRKKDVLDFLLSGKLVCGNCNEFMVGESGTGKHGERHYYYNCLSRRRKKHDCKFKAIKKQYLEDFIMKTTWQLLCDEKVIDDLANKILEKHKQIHRDNVGVKALQQKKEGLENACNNLISAIEQGFLTEQTKTRLRELEAQISQINFEIEEEKRRTYNFLNFEDIKEYLMSIANGDIDDINVRRRIVKLFIREIIVYSDRIIIIYNFTNQHHTTDDIIKEIEEIKKQSEMTVLNNSESSYINASFPPSGTDNI